MYPSGNDLCFSHFLRKVRLLEATYKIEEEKTNGNGPAVLSCHDMYNIHDNNNNARLL